MPDRPLHLHTRCLHGPRPDAGAPTSTPLYLSSAFAFERSADMAAVLAGTEPGFSYGRLGNPTRREAELRLASLEEGADALLTASGMAAIGSALLSVAGAGDHLVAATALYGNTRSLLTGLLARLGLSVDFAPPGNPAAAAGLVGPRTRALYVETIANPTMEVADLPGWAAIAWRVGLPLLVDSTFATPMLCQPLKHGASLVLHSATKYLSGHGDLLAGVVVGDAARVEAARRVAQDLGAVGDPFAAWLLLRGLATLPLRVERQAATAHTLVAWLRAQPQVAAVHHPEPTHWLRSGSGMLALRLHGGRSAGERFLDALGLFLRAPTLGDVHSLAVHPASTTHRQLSAPELAAAGIDPGLVRLSVGLEDPADLQADLAQALRAAAAVGG
jgi:cystathionine beta-lyase/cystathionine gamma-synthase